MALCDIHLNQRGINSIEAPAGVAVSPGGTLALRLINHGIPLHLTLRSDNSRMFTRFCHENLYVSDEYKYRIPILPNAPAGTFVIGIITGYGGTKAQVTVDVREGAGADEPAPAEAPPPQDMEGTQVEDVQEMPGPAVSLCPLRQEIQILPASAVTVSLILYAYWLIVSNDFFNYLAYAALLAGVIAAWFMRR